MKALKLKGWVDGIVGTRSKAEIASANWYAVKLVPDMARATLVVGEKAYTETEVKKLLQDLDDAIARTHQISVIFDGILAKHGIVLDPA